jgi:hypothetical protein
MGDTFDKNFGQALLCPTFSIAGLTDNVALELLYIHSLYLWRLARGPISRDYVRLSSGLLLYSLQHNETPVSPTVANEFPLPDLGFCIHTFFQALLLPYKRQNSPV